jgi:hypothetical protein
VLASVAGRLLLASSCARSGISRSAARGRATVQREVLREVVNRKLSILPSARSGRGRKAAFIVGILPAAAGVWAGQGCGPLGAGGKSEGLNPFKPHFPTAHFNPTSISAGSLPIFLRLRGQFFLTPLSESVE